MSGVEVMVAGRVGMGPGLCCGLPDHVGVSLKSSERDVCVLVLFGFAVWVGFALMVLRFILCIGVS